MENKDRAKYFSHKKIIGIDPGASGGIAIYDSELKKLIEVAKMPDTPMDVLNFFKMYSRNSYCFLEKVQGMPGQGGSAMFNFGKGFGQLQMALLACKIPTQEVTPQKWQKEYQLGGRGNLTKTEWKNKLKAKAQQLFPNIKVTLDIADALLIVEYGRRNIV